jgi:hypothetical protein
VRATCEDPAPSVRSQAARGLSPHAPGRPFNGGDPLAQKLVAAQETETSARTLAAIRALLLMGDAP